MSDLDELFDAMDTVAGGGGSSWFETGVYKVELTGIEWIPKGFTGTTCKFHFKILESNAESAPVGSTRTWFTKFKKTKQQDDAFMADIKNLIFAIGGKDPKLLRDPDKNPQAHQQAAKIFKAAISKEFAEQSGIKQDMLLGKQCMLEVIPKPKKNGSGDFSKHVWGPLPKAA